VLREIAENYPILTPTANNWLESGRILAKMRTDQGFEPAKLRDLHFDVLIALTVRSDGALLITSNRGDFELIRSYRDFKLEVW
jgi:predicted nucleic acid-binding protein